MNSNFLRSVTVSVCLSLWTCIKINISNCHFCHSYPLPSSTLPPVHFAHSTTHATTLLLSCLLLYRNYRPCYCIRSYYSVFLSTPPRYHTYHCAPLVILIALSLHTLPTISDNPAIMQPCSCLSS